MIQHELNFDNPVHEYNGYRYSYEREKEADGDNIKNFHRVRTPSGDEVVLDWSPYEVPTESDFNLWIDLGMPKRDAIIRPNPQCLTPFSHGDMEQILQIRKKTTR